MVKKINLAAIRIDGGTQARVEINNEVVSEYADAINAGAEFPPVVLFHDGADHWLADGFHRYHGHKQAGKVSLSAEVRDGTKRDAILFSLGANNEHGIRPNNADKRKAVETMLSDPEWAAWSQEKIAKICRVSAGFVSKLVKEAASLHGEEIKPTVRVVERAGKVYQQDTSRIGKTEQPKPVKRTLDSRPTDIPALTSDDELREASNTIADLARENDELRDRLAVESMDGSESAKTEAAETIRELRAQVKTLEAELSAVKTSRDTYMREASEAKRQVNYWRKKAEKAEGAAA